MIPGEFYATMAADMAALAIWLFLVGTMLCVWAMQEIGNRITSGRTIETVFACGILLLIAAPVVGIYSYTLTKQEVAHAPDNL